MQDILDKGFDLQAFKLLVLSKHYRTEGNFSFDILQSAANRLNNWYDLASLRHQVHQTVDSNTADSADVNNTVAKAGDVIKNHLANDLDTPAALAYIEEVFSAIESLSHTELDKFSLVAFLESIRDMLGIDLLKATLDITDDQKKIILERQRARDDKDWQRSDELRDELNSQNIAVRDTSTGSVWTRLQYKR